VVSTENTHTYHLETSQALIKEVAMIKSVGLINGHYQCRSFDDSIPILTDLLALEVVAEKDKEMILKHPNTDWRFE